MTDCTFGDTTFENANMIAGVGSIFSEGSLTMIVALVEIVVSIVSIVANIASNKKKTFPPRQRITNN